MCDQHNTNKDKQPLGSAIEHGEAHERDHNQWSRRSFLRNVGIAGSMSMILGKTPLTALASSPLSMALTNSNSDRILVLIRLKGGNDGLNMVIPLFDYGTYQAYRPDIAIPQNDIISLNPEFGIPNSMGALENLWQDGAMKVVNSVGYTNQNLSHFRSTDIWTSASDANQLDNSGWLGRVLDQQYPDFLTNPPDTPPAIQIGGSGNNMFTNPEDTNMGVIVSNPEELYEIAQSGELYDPIDVPECYYGEQLTFLRTVSNSTFRYAEVIAEAYAASSNAVNYTTSLGEQLALVARLIKGGLDTRLYVVSLDGFDTHATQDVDHPPLLNNIAEAVQSFYLDLAAGGEAERVLSMTFSEFGRRLEQNASNGTDHGAASPLMMFGEGLNGNGFVGPNPDLHNLDDVGNLQFGVDFRQIYATVLEQWLCIESGMVDTVLGQSFTRMPEIGLSCGPVSSSFVNTPTLQHRALYGAGEVTIEYTLPDSMPVTVQIFDILGRPVETLFQGNQLPGTYRYSFRSREARLSTGIYVYSIQAGRQRYSQKIRLVR
ncbi:MAG: hypothetical protein DHS20C18_39310 [Saprospiraceae bacterium]|nr:MAG: hypothetical protein DHS20C18_39310 [Saprospiraceae bacterium]